jgi:hypothetical protein
MVTPGLVGAGAALPMAGNLLGSAEQVKLNTTAFDERGGNIARYHAQIRENSQNYLDGVKLDDGTTNVKGVYEINREFADNMSDQTRIYTDRTAGAINAGAAIQRDGIEREATMGLEANRVRFDAQIEAAGITRDASFKAADMHAQEALIRAAGSVISHEIKNALSQRY